MIFAIKGHLKEHRHGRKNSIDAIINSKLAQSKEEEERGKTKRATLLLLLLLLLL